MTNILQGFGYSRIGHEHILAHLSNQDAWGLRHYRVGTLAVVSDGLGSKKHSDFGSLQAVLAAFEAFRGWSKTPHAPVRGFVVLLNTYWNIRTHGHERGECAATCLVAISMADRLVTVQLGDGLIATLGEDESIERVTPPSSDFINETRSLGSNARIEDWIITEREALQPEEQLLLCTDGVSEMIEPSKLPAFMSWLREIHTEHHGRGRHAKLSRSFAQLPTARRADDATLVTLWRNAS